MWAGHTSRGRTGSSGDRNTAQPRTSCRKVLTNLRAQVDKDGKISYLFRSEWRLAAAPDDVYLALAKLEDYPTWWPEVRTAARIDPDSCRLTCRSVLPYDLDFVTRRTRQDPQARILEAHLDGDLEGFSRWTLTATETGTSAVFDEEVRANKVLLRILAPIARPAFRLNHRLMMNHGRRGLSTYLSRMLR